MKTKTKRKRKIYYRLWRRKNRDKTKLYEEKRKDKKKQWYKSYYQRIKEKKIQQGKAYRLKIKRKIFELLGNKCNFCGNSDLRVLQIDHIKGKGTKMRKDLGASKYYQKILRALLHHSQQYQLLCANCNWIKRLESDKK